MCCIDDICMESPRETNILKLPLSEENVPWFVLILIMFAFFTIPKESIISPKIKVLFSCANVVTVKKNKKS